MKESSRRTLPRQPGTSRLENKDTTKHNQMEEKVNEIIPNVTQIYLQTLTWHNHSLRGFKQKLMVANAETHRQMLVRPRRMVMQLGVSVEFLTVRTGAVSDTLDYFWNLFPPIGWPHPVLMIGDVSSFILQLDVPCMVYIPGSLSLF